MEKNDLIDVTPPAKHKNKGREPGSKNLPMSIIIAEMKAGKTPKQIAETYGYTPAGIRQRLNKNGFSIHALKTYKEHRADIFAHIQSQVMGGMTPEKIKAASLRDLAVAANNLHGMERLERGQATSNVNIATLTTELSEIEEQIALLEAKKIPEEK